MAISQEFSKTQAIMMALYFGKRTNPKASILTFGKIMKHYLGFNPKEISDYDQIYQDLRDKEYLKPNGRKIRFTREGFNQINDIMHQFNGDLQFQSKLRSYVSSIT